MAKKKRSSSSRERIETGRNKMHAKRTTTGRFNEMDDVGRSLSADRRKTAKKKVKSGFGDQGDRAKGSAKGATKGAARGEACKPPRRTAGVPLRAASDMAILPVKSLHEFLRQRRPSDFHLE